MKLVLSYNRIKWETSHASIVETKVFLTFPNISKNYFVKSRGYFSLQIFYKTNLYFFEKAHLV